MKLTGLIWSKENHNSTYFFFSLSYIFFILKKKTQKQPTTKKQTLNNLHTFTEHDLYLAWLHFSGLEHFVDRILNLSAHKLPVHSSVAWLKGCSATDQ